MHGSFFRDMHATLRTGKHKTIVYANGPSEQTSTSPLKKKSSIKFDSSTASFLIPPPVFFFLCDDHVDVPSTGLTYYSAYYICKKKTVSAKGGNILIELISAPSCILVLGTFLFDNTH